MKKKTYDAKLKKGEMFLAARQYGKALKNFIELYDSDKPLGLKLGLPEQIKKCEAGLDDEKFLAIRGLGVIVVEALNKKNQFQEIYRRPIERKVDENGEDIHPLRLPAVVRTRFIKATNEDMLNEEIEKFKSINGTDPNSEIIISDLEGKYADLKEAAEKLISEDVELKTCVKTQKNDLKLLGDKNEALESEIKTLESDNVELNSQTADMDPVKISELKVEHEAEMGKLNDELQEVSKDLDEKTLSFKELKKKLEGLSKELEKFKKVDPKKKDEGKL